MLPYPTEKNRYICRKSLLKPGAGFTLLELLTVLAVISILAALLIPGAKAMTERSKSVKCQNNLRQIGAALISYAADNNQTLPANQAWASQDNAWWCWELNPYLGVAEGTTFNPAYLCPSSPYSDRPGDHSWNMSYAYSLSEAANGLRMPAIVRPSNFFLCGDTTQQTGARSAGHILQYPQNQIVTPVAFDNDTNGTQWGWVRFRHSQAANMLFADGHVEAISRTSAESSDWKSHWENKQ